MRLARVGFEKLQWMTGWLGKLRRRHHVLIALEIVAALLLVFALGAVVLGWRLSQGPVSVMNFQNMIRNTLNAEISNAEVRFADAVVLWDDNGLQFRLVDIRLDGPKGELIAGAPQAAVSLAPASLFFGKLRVSHLILVKPVITLSRDRAGAFNLGFHEGVPGKTSAPAGQGAAVPDGGQNAASSENEPTPDAGAGPASGDEADTVSDGETDDARAKPLWQALFTDPKLDLLEVIGIGPESSLTHIGVRDAALALVDEVSGQVWQAKHVRLSFSRTSSTDTFFGSATFEVDKAESHLTMTASMNRTSRDINVLTRFRDLDPSDFAPLLSELMLSRASLPLSGNAALTISGKGRLLSASADLESGAGLVGIPGLGDEPLLIDESVFSMSYDGEADQLAISRLSFSSGSNQVNLHGSLSPKRGTDGYITGAALDLTSDRMALALGARRGKVQKPLRLESARLRGHMNLSPFTVDLDELALSSGKLSLRMKGSYADAELSPELSLAGTGRAIPVWALKRLWPLDVSSGTREWIDDNITAGTVDRLDFKVNLQPGDIAAAAKGVPLPDDSIRLDFDLSGVDFHYIRGLPQITGARGHGRLMGDSFSIDVKRAKITSPSGRRVNVTSGRFFIPETSRDVSRGYADGRITVGLAGETRGILEILDMKPLAYIRKMNIKPADVSGTAAGELNITLPLLRDLDLDQIRIAARVQLEKTAIPQVIPDLDLSDGRAQMDITNDGLVAKGKIRLNGVPADLVWTESFVTSQKPSSRFELTGVLNDANRNALGVDVSEFLTGRTHVSLVATGRRGGISDAQVKAELKDAVLKSDEIVWRKPVGVPAQAAFRLAFRDNGLIQLRDLKVSGKNLTIRGGLDFTGKGDLLALNLQTLRLGPVTRMALSGTRDKNDVLHLKLSGNAFDARPLLSDLFSSSTEAASEDGEGEGRHVVLTGNIGTIIAHNGVRLSRASLDMESIGDTLERFLLVGSMGEAQPFRMSIARKNAATRKLTITGKDSGAILKGADFYRRIRRGSFMLNADMLDAGDGPDMTGVIRISDFNIVDEPALKSILSSSKSKGAKEISAHDVPFDKFRVKFSRENSILSFEDGLIAGPSIGATARGSLDNRRNTVQVAGTLVPAYSLNTALGKIPVLGRILSGREGEGLIGITFAISGKRGNPAITVNPVSALAPGFLRILFEFHSGKKVRPHKTQPESLLTR